MADFSAMFGLFDDIILFEDLSFLEFCDIIISHFNSVFLSSFSTSALPSFLWFLGKGPTMFCLWPSHCVAKCFPSAL